MVLTVSCLKKSKGRMFIAQYDFFIIIKTAHKNKNLRIILRMKIYPR